MGPQGSLGVRVSWKTSWEPALLPSCSVTSRGAFPDLTGPWWSSPPAEQRLWDSVPLKSWGIRRHSGSLNTVAVSPSITHVYSQDSKVQSHDPMSQMNRFPLSDTQTLWLGGDKL